MPIVDIMILCFITLAFLAFAAILAWGDRQTRDIAAASRARALAGTAAAMTERKSTPQSPLRPAEQKKSEREPVHA